MKLEPDDEQQQGDADFGNASQLLGIGDEAQYLRPDQRAADDIAQRRAQAELAEQGDEYQRRAEHDRAALEQEAGRPGCLGGGRCARYGGKKQRHPAPSIAASSVRNGKRIAPWRPVRERAGARSSRPGQLPTASSLPPSHASIPRTAERTSSRPSPCA